MSGIFASSVLGLIPIDTSQDYGLTWLLETFPQTVWAFQKTSASDESAFALTRQYLVRWTPLPTLSLNDTMKSLARYGRPMCCRSLTGQARFISCTSVLPTRALACAADSPLKMAASANACLHRYHNAKVLIKRPFHLPKDPNVSLQHAPMFEIPHSLQKR